MAAAVFAADRPNILIILSDDMGYTHIGCYGGEIETPVPDGLAANGLRFTQFYNTGRCCPTRASLLTGLYPHQTGVGWMTAVGHEQPGYIGELNKQCVTIAEALKPAGYSNYMVGKWHVARDKTADGPKYNWPLQRGFDKFYGTIFGAGSFFDPHSLVRGNKMISPFADPAYQPETYYYTDAISDHAARYIREHQQEEPFFMYVAYAAAHWPMHALPEDIEKYKGRYGSGFAPVRQARFKKAKQLGVIDPNVKLTPQAMKQSEILNKKWNNRNMEVYAAMVDRMDQGIGKIVQTLKQTGQFDNTLVFYLQDNGGCAEGWKRKGKIPRAGKPTLPPLPNDTVLEDYATQTRDGWPILSGPAVMPGPADTYSAYGRGWANVSNTPFREYKHWVHEGGIATPLIASWPDGIKARGGLCKQPGHLIDLMATCVDLSGATYPGAPIKPMEGRSLVPAFGNQPIQRDALYWEHECNRAIRVGDWKLVSKGWKKDGGYGTWKHCGFQPWELYNMADDRSEMNDLVDKHPGQAKALAAKWNAYAKRANVFPMPWVGNK